MIDLEAVIERHLTKDKMEDKTFYEGHVVIDLYNCVEEIKRLRAHRELCTENLLRGYEMGKAEECVATVAWLRSDEPHRLWAGSIGGCEYTCAADAIENGEHRKES